MKTKLFLLAALAVLASGCAIVDQTVSEISRPDGTTEKITRNKNWVTGNAKQVVEQTKLSQGKTQSIGTSGAGQEAQSPFKDAAEMLKELNALKTP